ncbi:MAG: ChaN family lipoprotein [bacterium]|nr:ChaN family lipoprotein [bacterium]
MFTFRQSGRRPYQFYDKGGTSKTEEEVVRQLGEADVVLFGELHNHPVIHQLQYDVTRGLFERFDGRLVLGAEMFEADNQIVLDEYLAGLIKHDHLVREAKVWGNYDPDYRPLVEFAKEHGLPFIATNIPRRYANLVAREGIDALRQLSDQAKQSMAPLPIHVDMATPGYREMMGMGHGMGSKGENFVAAQAVKDATMAYFVLRNRAEEGLFLHFNGDYHSRRYGGICWYLNATAPKLRVQTITSVESESGRFEAGHGELGDQVLLVPPTA